MKTAEKKSRKGSGTDPQTPKHKIKVESFPIVGIGASAGGLEAFQQLLETLPNDTGMSYVLVQHLDPKHESSLSGILSKSTAMQVESE